MKWCLESGLELDAVSVWDRVKVIDPHLEYVTLSYLGELSEHAPVASHIETYAKMVKEKYCRRQLAVAALEITQMCQVQDTTAMKVIEFALTKILDIDNQISFVSDAVGAVKRLIQRIKSRQGKDLYGFTFGNDIIDAITYGIMPGNFNIWGATSGVGKTTLMTAFALIQAMLGIPTLYISLEMLDLDLIEVMLPGFCKENGFDFSYDDLRDNNIPVEKLEQLEKLLMEKFAKLPIYFCMNKYSLQELFGTIREHQINKGVKHTYVDHIQLINGSEDYSEYHNITKQFKRFCMNYETSITGISQLNTEYDKRADKEVYKSDFRGGKTIVQDSDVAFGIYKMDEAESQVYIKILKNRMGKSSKPYFLKVLYNEEYRNISLELCDRPKREGTEDATFTSRRRKKRTDNEEPENETYRY